MSSRRKVEDRIREPKVKAKSRKQEPQNSLIRFTAWKCHRREFRPHQAYLENGFFPVSERLGLRLISPNLNTAALQSLPRNCFFGRAILKIASKTTLSYFEECSKPIQKTLPSGPKSGICMQRSHSTTFEAILGITLSILTLRLEMCLCHGIGIESAVRKLDILLRQGLSISMLI